METAIFHPLSSGDRKGRKHNERVLKIKNKNAQNSQTKKKLAYTILKPAI
jgi:hypothetical protein